MRVRMFVVGGRGWTGAFWGLMEGEFLALGGGVGCFSTNRFLLNLRVLG